MHLRFSLLGLLSVGASLAGCDPGNSAPFSTPVSASPAPPPIATPAPPSTPHTLSGLVYESTATGRLPVEGVHVYCDGCGSPVGHTSFFTASDGFYRFGWAFDGAMPLLVQKEGYAVVGATDVLSNGMSRRSVTINGDTQFDIELIRR